MKRPIPFGKYYLLERVNVGGMAEVFKAKTYGVEGFERLLAVKRILPNIAEDEEFITMFIDEAKIAVQLTHANIAQIFDLGKVEDSYFIALEYVHGKDLRGIFDRLRTLGDGMPIPQACFIIMKVCEGLDYAHNKRDSGGREMHLVHRDVSPQNVLISYEGEVKLVDFGIAKAVGKASKTEAGILKGKFGYMSPEQVRGLPLDRRSDIFSVGIVLYELLTGERLFLGESDFSTLEKVRNVEILPPSTYNRKIAEELEQIVLKALAKDVDDRYQNAIDLHDDLQAYMYTSGEFYSRKDLASWMKRFFAREIEEEGRKLEEYRQLSPPPGGGSAVEKVVERPRIPTPVTGGNGTKPPQRLPGTPPPMPVGELAAVASPGFAPPIAKVSSVAGADGLVASVPAVDQHNSAPALSWDDDEVETQIYDKPGGGSSPALAALDSDPVDDLVDVAALAGTGESAASRIVDPSLTTAKVTRKPTGRQTAAVPPLVALEGPERRSSSTGMWVGLAVAVAVVCGAVLWYYLFHKAQPGQIAVRATPGDVQIFLDGTQQPAKGTPYTIQNLKPGSYQLMLVKQGYEAWREKVQVNPGETAQVTIELALLGTAKIELWTTPEGGTAYLDRQQLPGKTSMRITEVAPGKHVLEVRLPSYQPWKKEIEVTADEPYEVRATLLAAEVVVTVSAEPRGAGVSLVCDGREEAAGAAPVKLRLDPKHTCNVVVRKDGYAEWRQEVRFEGDKPIELNAKLDRVGGGGGTADKGFATKPTPHAPGHATAGTRPSTKVPVQRPEPKQAPEAPKTVEPPKPVEPPAQGGSGFLMIGSNPWTKIFIDGQSTGLTTPQRRIVLPAGRHTVTLRNPTFNIDTTFPVQIRAGQETKVIKRNLAP